jgi:tetratricopeptide (TPR) repeat protein
LSGSVNANGPWHVEQAQIRFDLDITAPPSTPAAGVLVVLPDAGILPRPLPECIVVDAAGNTLSSACVWFNPSEGLGLVFTPPAKSRTATVYVSGGGRFNPWTPGSGFAPGLLLYTQAGMNTLDAARQMAREFPAGKSARCGQVDRIGQVENLFGADDNFVSYYTGWLKIVEPGAYYFATISDEGTQCFINNQPVAEWLGKHDPQEGRKGQHGGSITLRPGLHRIEYFHHETDGGQLAQLVWKKPGTADDALPETVPPTAFVSSGKARIVAATTRSGAPLAFIEDTPQSYLWAGDAPVFLYEFNVGGGAGVAGNSRFSWQFGPDQKAAGPNIPWLFEGERPGQVILLAQSDAGTSRAQRAIRLDTYPRRASPLHPPDRQAYRNALLFRCRSVLPVSQPPCRDWSENLWATLLAVVEPFEDNAVMIEIFERSRPQVLQRPVTERHRLEDIFYDTLRLQADDATPERVLSWLDRLATQETDKSRAFHWQLQRVECLLHEAGNADAARALTEKLRPVAAQLGGPHPARVLVRLGDIHRLQGRHDEAQTIYSQAQDLYRQQPDRIPAPRPGRQPPVIRTLEDIHRDMLRRDTNAPPAGQPPPARATEQPGALPLNDWRSEAVRVTTYHETVKNLVSQQYYYEARDVLARWELEFPLSKLTGDYPLAEGIFLAAVGDNERAVATLSAYRRGVDISNFLPDAMSIELDCLVRLERFDAVKELATDIQKRLPTHPVAVKAGQYRAAIERGQPPKLPAAGPAARRKKDRMAGRP